MQMAGHAEPAASSGFSFLIGTTGITFLWLKRPMVLVVGFAHSLCDGLMLWCAVMVVRRPNPDVGGFVDW